MKGKSFLIAGLVAASTLAVAATAMGQPYGPTPNSAYSLIYLDVNGHQVGAESHNCGGPIVRTGQTSEFIQMNYWHPC